MTDWESLHKQYEANWQALDARDKAAKAAGTLVGRYIKHAFADSFAVYEITKVTKRTAHIKVVTGIGDDWVLPAWGESSRISLKIAQELVDHRDRMDALFGGKTVLKLTPEILKELKGP